MRRAGSPSCRRGRIDPRNARTVQPSPPPQVLQTNGRLCHLVLAFPLVGGIANGRAPSLRGHYSASLLLRTRPPPSRLQPPSRCRRLYDLPCSDDFSPGRGRLLQFLGMSLSPCFRFHPAEMNSRVGQVSAVHAAFALQMRARPSDLLTFEATTRSLLLRPGDSLISPREILSMGFRIFGFPPSCHPNYGAPDSCPGRSVSC